MKKVFLLASLFAGLVLLTGCKDKTHLQNHVINAFEALKNGDFPKFRDHLSGKALEQYRSDQAADALKREVESLGQVDIDKEQETGSQTLANGGKLTHYKLSVKWGRQEVAQITADCRVDVYTTTRTVCEDPNPPVYNPPDDYEPNPPRYDGRNDDNYSPREPTPSYDPPSYNTPSNDYVRPDDTPRDIPHGDGSSEKPGREDGPPRFRARVKKPAPPVRNPYCHEVVETTQSEQACRIVDIVVTK